MVLKVLKNSTLSEGNKISYYTVDVVITFYVVFLSIYFLI